jgi:hypothetical protein
MFHGTKQETGLVENDAVAKIDQPTIDRPMIKVAWVYFSREP